MVLTATWPKASCHIHSRSRARRAYKTNDIQRRAGGSGGFFFFGSSLGVMRGTPGRARASLVPSGAALILYCTRVRRRSGLGGVSGGRADGRDRRPGGRVTRREGFPGGLFDGVRFVAVVRRGAVVRAAGRRGVRI